MHLSKVYDIELQRYRNLKIRVCDKDSIYSVVKRWKTNQGIRKHDWRNWD